MALTGIEVVRHRDCLEVRVLLTDKDGQACAVHSTPMHTDDAPQGPSSNIEVAYLLRKLAGQLEYL